VVDADEHEAGGGFGQMLRELRHAAGLSQEELAERSGLSIRAIGDMERRSVRPYPRSVRLLAEALQLTDPVKSAFEQVWRGQGQPSPAAATGSAAAATRTLPRDIASFTGRRTELDRLAEAAADTGGVVGIQAIGGMAGVGKTAFAIYAAHRLAPRFPDGQVFLPLHGHTPGYSPVDPGDALASLLLTAGLSAAQIPPELEARARLWRDHLAGRRMLLVFDDAIGTGQIAPLLPGTGQSLVLVTSRRHLTALEDAQVISLDVLPPGEAAALLVRLAARPGLTPQDTAVATICRLCGYLPLAIGMLARQLHHHPTWTPRGLAADLAAARDRLDLMTAENVSVAAGFDVSYADLTDEHRRLFRRIGLHPGSDIDAYAAAALDGCPLTVARRRLAVLYEHYLLTEPAAGRYRLHDLLREHAHTLAFKEDTDTDRDQTLGRLMDYYARTAALADLYLTRHTRPAPEQTPDAALPVSPRLTDGAAALAWARTERTNLLACLDQAAHAGDLARVAALTAGVAGLLRRDGPWADAITRHNAAVRALRQSGDRLGLANALSDLGEAHRWTGDYPDASEALEEALTIYRDLGNLLGQANTLNYLAAIRLAGGDYQCAAQLQEEGLAAARAVGDRRGQAGILNYLGVTRQLTGDFPGAAQAQEEALVIYRELGDRRGVGNALNNLGGVCRFIGDYQGAARAQEEALVIYRDLGDRYGEANALYYLGIVRRAAGDLPAAARTLDDALAIYRDLGSKTGEGNALSNLGAVWTLTGDLPGAARVLETSLDIYRSIGDLGGEVEALNGMGTLQRTCGDLSLAGTYHQRALKLAREIDAAWDEAHALAGLARCALAAGHRADAIAGLREAEALFLRIGAAEAADVAAEMTALADAEH
jgi:tetratricopeptide (TPR) repeat protein/transcriptional regulator with XRE-family HTH domain